MNRRQFLKTAGSATLLAAATQGVSLVIDPADSIASAGPSQWAARDLRPT